MHGDIGKRNVTRGDSDMKYDEFLRSKERYVQSVGFDVPESELNPMLFDWQRKIVKWALKRGRSALFEDCGLGKTAQQLEWAHHVQKHTGRNVLILTPPAVAKQTEREAQKFGIDAHRSREGELFPITITNYQRLHYYHAEDFAGIVLDESSILKSFDGIVRKEITDFARAIHFRLACTATPAPNDLIELTNHAEFLDVMSGKEIIALFFKQDGNTTHAWRLKHHAEEAFWRWMAQWSIAMRKPSDLGYDDGDFILPELRYHDIHVDGNVLDGELFAVEATDLLSRRRARSKSMQDRVEAASAIANDKDDQILIWCDLNSESEALAKRIEQASEVRGSDSLDYKETTLESFSNGLTRALVTKPTIAGHGLNWQNCNTMIFVGLSDSYEQFYQAVRRCWRFGQKKPVDVYIVTATTEGAVTRNIQRKEEQARSMFDNIVRQMRDFEEVNMQQRDVSEYETETHTGEHWTAMLGDSCERIKEIESDSVGLSIFSPPFPGMYAYTNSPRDVGNVRDWSELITHFAFLMPEILRITMPGRICCVHLTQEPVFKGREGYVGLRDFRGDVIRRMSDEGWLYYSEVTIDKNPMLKASRTKEGTLLFKTLSKDSSSCRPALADYLLVFKKPGENPKPIPSGTHPRWNPDGGWISSDEWCEWASPVWYRAMPTEKGNNAPFQPNYPSRHQATDGILETDVLQYRAAKDEEDEKHLAPLQLGVIERAIKLWSAPGDTVFSPFAGIGSEGYQAVRLHRRFIGIELKNSYYRVQLQNLQDAERKLIETETPLFQDVN